MSKLADNRTMHAYRVTRRQLLQAGTVGALSVLTAGSSNLRAEEAGKKGLLKAGDMVRQKHLLWQPTAELTVHVLPPEFTAVSGKQGQRPLPLKVQLAASRIQEDRANFDYNLTID